MYGFTTTLTGLSFDEAIVKTLGGSAIQTT